MSFSDEVNKAKAEANRAFRSHRYEEAETLYTRTLELLSSPDAERGIPADRLSTMRSVLHANRAATRIRRGDAASLEGAVRDAETSVRINPRNWKAYVRLSQAHEALGDRFTAAMSLMRCAPDLRNAHITDRLKSLLGDLPSGPSRPTTPLLRRQSVSDWVDVDILLRREFLWTFCVTPESDLVSLLRGVSSSEGTSFYSREELYNFIRTESFGRTPITTTTTPPTPTPAVQQPEVEEEGEGVPVVVAAARPPAVEEDTDERLLVETVFRHLLQRWCVVRKDIHNGALLPKLIGFLEGLRGLSDVCVLQQQQEGMTCVDFLCDAGVFSRVRSQRTQEDLLEVVFVLRRLLVGHSDWESERDNDAFFDRVVDSGEQKLAPRLQMFREVFRGWLARAIEASKLAREEQAVKPRILGGEVNRHRSSDRTVRPFAHAVLIDVHDEHKLRKAKFILRDWSVRLSGYALADGSRPILVSSLSLAEAAEDGGGRGPAEWLVALRMLGRARDSRRVFLDPVWGKFHELLLGSLSDACEVAADAVDGMLEQPQPDRAPAASSGGDDVVEDAEDGVVKERIDVLLDFLAAQSGRVFQLPGAIRLLSNVLLLDEERYGAKVAKIVFPTRLRDALAELYRLPRRTTLSFEQCRFAAVLSTCSSLAMDAVKFGIPPSVLRLLLRGKELDSRAQHVLWQAQQSIMTSTRLHSMRSVAKLGRVAALDVSSDTEVTIPFIPPIPLSDRAEWRVDNARRVFQKCCERSYMSCCDCQSGHAIFLRFFRGNQFQMMGMNYLCVMLTLSFFNNELREFGILPIDDALVMQIMIPMMKVDGADMSGRDNPERFALKPFVPLSDQTYFNLIMTAYKLTNRQRKMTQDEKMALQFVGANFIGIEPVVGTSLVDVLMRDTPRLDALMNSSPRLSFADMRALVYGPQFRLFSLSFGDWLEIGTHPPAVEGQDAVAKRCPTPIPKVVHDFIVAACEMAPFSETLMTILGKLAKLQAWYMSRYGADETTLRVVKDLLLTADELEAGTKPLLQIPFALAFFERSVYSYHSEFGQLTPAMLLHLRNSLFTLEQILAHCMDRSRQYISVLHYPRVPWIERNSARLDVAIRQLKMKHPRVSPSSAELSTIIRQQCEADHEHYDRASLERAMLAIVPTVESFLRMIWSNLQTVPERETRCSSEIARAVADGYRMSAAGRLPRDVAGPCRFCGRLATMKCVHCQRRSYCSMECARGDWSAHKADCQGQASSDL